MNRELEESGRHGEEQRTMIKVIPKATLSASMIAALRNISGRSLADIRRASAEQCSIRDVALFASNWQTERLFLAELARQYSGDPHVPFTVWEADEAGLDEDEELDPERFMARLKLCREIELEQQMHSDLEMGYITSPEQFTPHDDHWI